MDRKEFKIFLTKEGMMMVKEGKTPAELKKVLKHESK